MKLIQSLTLVVASSLFLAQSAMAQELRLFEEPEGEAQQQVMPTSPEQVFNTGGGQPAYTLRSISRFGDQYHAVLVNRAGEIARVSWNAGETPQVPNSGFNVIAAGPSTLSLQHPVGDACVSSEPVGVSCAAGNQSVLRLTVAVPLASNGVAPVMGPQQPDGFFGNGNVQNGQAGFTDQAVGVYPPGAVVDGQQVFINPFSGEPEVAPQISPEELAARQQRQELRAARLRQFEAQRIEDTEIPAGMERVRTPFGDRLIQTRE